MCWFRNGEDTKSKHDTQKAPQIATADGLTRQRKKMVEHPKTLLSITVQFYSFLGLRVVYKAEVENRER